MSARMLRGVSGAPRCVRCVALPLLCCCATAIPTLPQHTHTQRHPYRSGTYFCVDKSVTAVVIQGLAEHKETLGAPLCPCRHYDDKAAEAANGFWNCPCVPMRERKVRFF